MTGHAPIFYKIKKNNLFNLNFKIYIIKINI